jgi:hypothetical protein
MRRCAEHGWKCEDDVKKPLGFAGQAFPMNGFI